MADLNRPANPDNWLEEPRKLPSMLNVLTMLTIIGSSLAACSQVYSFFTAKQSYDKMVAMQDKLDDLPEFMKSFMGPKMVEMARQSYENRVPILLLTFVALGLCIVGAVQMRKFKKMGFYIYLIGELLPIITGALFIGLGTFGGFGLVSALLFPAVFIILYATQLKHLS